jgi:hypothetical protein
MSRRQWLAAATTVVGAGAIAAIKGEEIWNWVQAEVLEVPAAIRDQYRDPNMTKDIIIPREGRYPYADSTMEVYAEEERRMFPDRDGTIVAVTIATNIANRVADQATEIVQKQLDKEAGGRADKVSHKDALNKLAETPEGMTEYVKLIGRELIRAGCYYKIEGSLDAAVDDRYHNSAKFHLDCDLLCHVALHCASRHDMPLQGMRAPQHMYIGSNAFGAFAVEMTAFRGERVNRMNGLRNETVTALGEGFITSQGAMLNYFSRRVSRAETERLGYFTPLDQNAMREGAVGNLLVELLTEGLQKKDPAELEYICAVGDRELKRFVGKDLVAQNVYAIHSLARDYYIKTYNDSEQKDSESQHRALFHARRIARLKESHGQYISRGGDRRDQQILEDLERGVAPAPEPVPDPAPNAPTPEPTPAPGGPASEPVVPSTPPGPEESVLVPSSPESTQSRRDFFNLFRGRR